MAVAISFKPKQVTKKLLKVLPERSQEVLTGRFGLGKETQKETLESIGQKYGITRERVRQIENHALGLIRDSEVYTESEAVFTELAGVVNDLGGVIAEKELLVEISKNESIQNHVHFLLVVGNSFAYAKEDSEFVHRWFMDNAIADNVHDALRGVYKKLSKEDLVPENELIDMFIEKLGKSASDVAKEDVVRKWLGLSKKLGRNPLGEWGMATAPGVRVKGMRDLAYLTLKRHGSPMHFGEVAKTIEELFDRSAHEATCHNELIKDDRFVLVGRGLYALKEWGYKSGVVKDVVKQILADEGPLTRSEILDRVKRERYVKDNTIMVNLQDDRHFGKDSKGRYFVK